MEGVVNSAQRNSVQRNSSGILRNVKIPPELSYKITKTNFRRFPITKEFRKIRIPPELFFNGILDTLAVNTA